MRWPHWIILPGQALLVVVSVRQQRRLRPISLPRRPRGGRRVYEVRRSLFANITHAYAPTQTRTKAVSPSCAVGRGTQDLVESRHSDTDRTAPGEHGGQRGLGDTLTDHWASRTYHRIAYLTRPATQCILALLHSWNASIMTVENERSSRYAYLKPGDTAFRP